MPSRLTGDLDWAYTPNLQRSEGLVQRTMRWISASLPFHGPKTDHAAHGSSQNPTRKTHPLSQVLVCVEMTDDPDLDVTGNIDRGDRGVL